MQEEHRRAIQNNFGSLVEQTDLDPIVSALYEKGVFSEAMIEPYRDTNKEVRARKRQLYRDIERRGPTAFGYLLESLTETGHWDLVRALDPDSVLHPRRVNPPKPGPSIPPRPEPYLSLSNKQAIQKKEPESQGPSKPYPPDFSNPDEATSEVPHPHVVKSTQFFNQSKEGFPLYGTRSRQRGALVAFSFIEFKNNIEEYRKGAVVDCNNLKYLFEEVGFKTVFYNNLTKEETEGTLEALKTNRSLEGKDCVFVVVSSHGYERWNTSDTDIRCSDGGLLSILSIIEHFNNKNSPHLRHVPKVFVFQTCRGSMDDYESTYRAPRHMSAPGQRASLDGADGAAGAEGTAGAASGRRGERDGQPAGARATLPAPPALRADDSHDRVYSDMLIAHSTLPGFVSRRDPEKGSWYIQALCEVFAARAHDCHLEELFTLVDMRLNDKFGPQTSSIDKWGFNKKLYLHPGLFEN